MPIVMSGAPADMYATAIVYNGLLWNADVLMVADPAMNMEIAVAVNGTPKLMKMIPLVLICVPLRYCRHKS